MVMAHPSPQQVGREFVRQYYTVLHEAPEVLHRFYSTGSTFVHGGVDRPGHVEEPVVGQVEIDKKIRALAFKDCHTKIRQVDAQATIGSAVVVQVTGELSNNGEPMRRFMQTFVLAPQNPKKFYVHNDIFRYQDEVYQDLSDTESEEVQQHTGSTAAATTPQQTPQQPSAPVQAAANVELKSASYYQAGQPEVNESQHGELDHPHHHHHHHHHHEHANASSASSTSSQALSSASSASAGAVTVSMASEHIHTEPVAHEQTEKPQASSNQPPVQQQQQPVQQTVQQDERKSNESSGVKENGPSSDVKSSWARIITHNSDGKEATPSNTSGSTPGQQQQQQQPTGTNSAVYSSNSLPRNGSGNKENRTNYHKQNGGYVNNNNGGQSKPQPNATASTTGGTAQQANSKPPRNAHTNTFANNTNAQSTSVSGPSAVGSSPASGRQNGGSVAAVPGGVNNETGQVVDGVDGEDKRFGGSTRYPDSHQVFVGNLSQDLSDAELKAFFGQYGRVVEVRINSNTKQMTGRRLPNYGFVVFEDNRSVENLLSSTKANNLTLKNDRGEFRLNIEEKRARQGRQSSGYGGGQQGVGKPRPNRSTSNGSGGAGGGNNSHMNGKKPQYRGEMSNEDGVGKRGGPGGGSGVTTNVYQRRS